MRKKTKKKKTRRDRRGTRKQRSDGSPQTIATFRQTTKAFVKSRFADFACVGSAEAGAFQVLDRILMGGACERNSIHLMLVAHGVSCL